jgi:lactate dehydrogenase-like 2-hydroxyacid dehydrogenase
MDQQKNLESENLFSELQAIATATHNAVQVCQGDVKALLALLRELERLHQEVRDGVFQASLPDNRQRLYSLLRDIESEGGWPYIERMRLRELFINLTSDQYILNNLANQKTEDDLHSDDSLEW